MAINLRGSSRSDYSTASFADVRGLIASHEAPDNLGGYDALAYNTSRTSNGAGVAAPKPISQMTIGELFDFQTGPMRAKTKGRRGKADVGSTGAGKYQFESLTMAENAALAFGPGWRDTPFSPANQDKVAETLFDRVKGSPKALANTWAAFQQGGGGAPPVASSPAPPAFSVGNLDELRASLGDVFKPREAAPHFASTAKTDALAAKRADIAALTGGQGVAASQAPDQRQLAPVREAQEDRTQAAVETKNASYTTWDRFSAGFQNNSLLSAITQAWDEGNPEADPAYVNKYLANARETEAGHTDQEIQELREATSETGLSVIKERIKARQDRTAVQFSGGETSGMLYGLAGGILDPVGLAAGVATGGAFAAANIGSRALWAGGRSLAAMGSIAAEGAIGNVAITAGLDLTGQHQRVEDYAVAAGFGAITMVGMSPLVLRGAKPDASVETAYRAIQQGAAQRRASFVDQAERNLGVTRPARRIRDQNMDMEFEGASIEAPVTTVPRAAVQAEAERLANEDIVNNVYASLSPVPERHKLFGVDEEGVTVNAHPERLEEITQRYNLEAVSEETDRSVIADMTFRSEQIVADNPIDPKKINTVLKAAGAESTGVTMLSDPSPVSKAMATVLLESTTGAAGRRPTAAMTQTMLERLYNKHLYDLDAQFDLFRKSEGRGIMAEHFDPVARAQFNRRVFAEVESRGGGVSVEAHPAVLRTADLWQEGMNRMRLDQQTSGTVGAARLGPDSAGYMTHRMIPAMAASLSKEQNIAVRRILSDQFVDEANGFDRAFSDKLAAKYLEAAKRRALGGFDVPMNLHDVQAADIVFDTAQALKLTPEQADKLLGKFSRGGAGHTKSRLKLDMKAMLPDGKGGEMPLMELFNQDITGMYRSYARRVSGEIALAQYGIQGKKGLNIAREAIIATGGQAPALRAFDQVAAEFLNTPFGSHNHKFMDNLRLLTSVSRLGGMGFTQLGEFTNAVAALGVHRALSSVGSFKRLAKEVGQLAKGGEAANPILKDIDTLNGEVGLDSYQLTRMFDNKDGNVELYSGESIGHGTKALRAAAHAQNVLSGNRMITAVQTRGMAEQIIRKAITYAKSGADDIALNDMGIGPELRAALLREMPNIAKFNSGGKLTELNLLDGGLTGAEVKELRFAIERGASQIIQRTYTGETGKWAHDGLLKLLTQFRTFSITSVEKQWGRNRANHGTLKAGMYLIGAMSLAAPIHMARVQSKMVGMSRSQREKYAEANLSVGAISRATLNYASASGLLGDIVDIGGGVMASVGGDTGESMAETIGVRGAGKGKLTGLVPAMGLSEDAWASLHGNYSRTARLLPGAAHPAVQPLFNAFTPDK